MLYRGEHAFVILNLCRTTPVTCWSARIATSPFYDDATEAETMEIAQLTQLAMKVLREVSHNDGFNIGINQGRWAARVLLITCISIFCRAGVGIRISCRLSLTPRLCPARLTICAWLREGFARLS